MHGVEDVLLSAADAGREGVGFLEIPAGGAGIEGPGLGVLFAAAALVVAAVAEEDLAGGIPCARAFIAEARGRGRVGEGAEFDPGVEGQREIGGESGSRAETECEENGEGT
ncbi:hypothetical protein LBMAG56_01760 [Verrucomicrobiota bacterium]|nr:hypothetical protein LBMAG56_01760 [Verrucomicrobiota bacterium]